MDDYFPSLLSSPLDKLRNPASLGIIDLYQLLSSIQCHQNLAAGIKLFTIPPSSKSATTGTQLTPPTDNPQVPSPSLAAPASVSPSQLMSPLPSLSPSPSRSLSPLPSATKAVSTASVPINTQPIIQDRDQDTDCTLTVPTASQPNIEKEKHNKRKADSTADSTNNTARPSKKKRNIATPQTIPEFSRRSNRVRKPQHSGDDVHHVQTIGNSKPVKPALTRSGKVAKGWVVAESESDG